MSDALVPLTVDAGMLTRFEAGLDPLAIHASPMPAHLIGYGEISAIFVIAADPAVAYKRMPLFTTVAAAEAYGLMHDTYCRHLRAAGLRLPASGSCVVTVPGRPVVLYIAQRRLPEDSLAHHRLWRLPPAQCAHLIEAVAQAITGVWDYNQRMAPEVTLGIDGQLSNWSAADGPPAASLTYFDTSTPLLRIGGREQLDPELLLQAAPVFLRWLLRLFFVDDVLNRYYDLRDVFVDLVANLYKEQRPDLIPLAVATVNQCRPADMPAIQPADIRRYYRQDRLIWQLFLAFRRVDRWMRRRQGRRYEFILPGHINR